jgi:uncharacterized membrane protein YcaP (DUF421 family)
MDSVISAAVVYVFLRLVIGLTARRHLGELSPFELVLLIVVGGAVQRALIGDDASFTHAFLIVATLLGLELIVSLIARRSGLFSRLLRGAPLIVVEHGRPLARRLYLAHLREEDVLAAARRHHGLTSLEDIRYAILETNGEISIVPERKGGPTRAKPDSTEKAGT